MSIVGDMMHGSPGMDPVIAFMNMKGSFARSWSKTLSSTRDQPIMHCENCTKSTEEIGRDVKFMLCSVCKLKLDFVMHYCSQ
jgi:predicted amidophosphoribosyltransferase